MSASLLIPRRSASRTHNTASASGVGMFVKLYAPSPIQVWLHTQVCGIRAAVAKGLVTAPKREIPPTIASTRSMLIARWMAALARAGSSPTSTRTTWYWYFVPGRSAFAIWTAFRKELPRIAYGPVCGTMTPILTTPPTGARHRSRSTSTKAATSPTAAASTLVRAHDPGRTAAPRFASASR